MIREIEDSFIDTFTNVKPPYSGSITEWVKENVSLPSTYAITGKCDLSTSPWLIPPLEDVQNPSVKMVIKIMGVRVGKSMTDEVVIPYWISQAPGTILRVHQDDVAAQTAVDTKLLPILRNTECVAPLVSDKKGVRKGLINLPHMFIRFDGDKEGLAHALGVRYLILDEAHLYDFGLIKKFTNRTLDFAGRSKIIISSTPNLAGSELEKYYLSGQVFEWQWKCPSCQAYQPYWWARQRNDLSYAGFNWETILTANGEHTDIAASAKTAWLECFHCRHKVNDTTANRRTLNDTGKYVCIKSDGDSSIHAYTCPLFVNINLSYEYFVTEYLKAKRIERQTGLNDDVITFVNAMLAKFFRSDVVADDSKIMRGEYIPNPTDYDKEWVNIMTVDYQNIGKIKYYVIRAWRKTGNESRRLAFGVCRTWDEIEDLRIKWNVRIPCLGVDSGAGNQTTEVYQECIKHGKPYNINGKYGYDCWIPMKGDGNKLSYVHENHISKYYAPISKQDPLFPVDNKFKGLSAPLVLWSNYSIKTILMNLRDNKIDGIKWLVDVKDSEYERMMYSEGLKTVVDKRTGATKTIWKTNTESEPNHYLDCEAMNLCLAIRANVFSATKIDEVELSKVLPQENVANN